MEEDLSTNSAHSSTEEVNAAKHSQGIHDSLKNIAF